jgi:fucose permease
MPPGRRHPHLVLLVAAVSVLSSVALCAAAILVPAPAAVVPLVALICVGVPMSVSWEIPAAVAAMRARRGHRALALLREHLERLPEVDHPLGF